MNILVTGRLGYLLSHAVVELIQQVCKKKGGIYQYIFLVQKKFIKSLAGSLNFQLKICEKVLGNFTKIISRMCKVAEWQSGHAADCKSVHAGSIPTSASKKIKKWKLPVSYTHLTLPTKRIV